jgi:hypothetical protein
VSAISLRLPESLHEAAREVAKRENISINQFITLALAEKLSALMTEEYLEKRARHGEQSRFDAALRKVPNVEPNQNDRLWSSIRLDRSSKRFSVRSRPRPRDELDPFG